MYQAQKGQFDRYSRSDPLVGPDIILVYCPMLSCSCCFGSNPCLHELEHASSPSISLKVFTSLDSGHDRLRLLLSTHRLPFDSGVPCVQWHSVLYSNFTQNQEACVPSNPSLTFSLSCPHLGLDRSLQRAD